MKPNNKIIAGLAFMAVCLTAFAVMPAERAEMNANAVGVITNHPQTNPDDAWSTRAELQNVGGDRYQWLVHSKPNFRAIGERKECGPTNDAPMHAECDASLGN
jgi:hypothetical protein